MFWLYRKDRRGRATAGFTLIELLVVIMIIGLLAGILIPAVSYAKVQANKASAKTLIHALYTAVGSFQSEQRLGKDFPPSNWNGADPYGGTTTDYGAQTLVWAVAGADMQGTPGFIGDTMPNLYDKTKHPRYGPFIDTKDLTIVKANSEKKCQMQGKLGSINDNAPVILDPFGMPVLYYKANQAGTDVASTYAWGDNSPFTSGDFVSPDANAFTARLTDPRTTKFSTGGGVRPYNYDSFILVTAGPDCRYFTPDDITNYQTNQ